MNISRRYYYYTTTRQYSQSLLWKSLTTAPAVSLPRHTVLRDDFSSLVASLSAQLSKRMFPSCSSSSSLWWATTSNNSGNNNHGKHDKDHKPPPPPPRGFEDFFPDGYSESKKETKQKSSVVPNKNNNNRNQEEDEDSPFRWGSKKKDTSSQQQQKKDNDTNQQTNQKKKKKSTPPPPLDDSNSQIPGILAFLALIVILNTLSENAEEKGREITFVEFRDVLLERTEKLVIVNQKIARVVLKQHHHHHHPQTSSSLGSMHDSSSLAISDAAAGHGVVGMMDSMDSMEQQHSQTYWTSSHDGTLLSNNNNATNSKKSSYYFYIGSPAALEEKLERAQSHKHPSQWIELQYITQTDWNLVLLKTLPVLAFVAALYFGSRSALGFSSKSGIGGGGSGGIFGIGKSNARRIKPEDVKVNFSDVAGCDEAKREIMEFVDFLKDSDRFTKLGAKIPKGALLCGPPGTGKTLLAKAVAGEAGVPFYSISGSDFVEMFVGVGPSRVRDLFSEARENAPCILFIDEIDAVGRQRGRGGFTGGNDERENTLNQLLVEMDGFSPSAGVVVLAGTNRADILDQALTRPGRFDRQILVDRPDLKGRKEIFMVHLKNIVLEGDSMEEYARRLAGLTPGFAGADIANICNEAAIVAARRKAESVSLGDFEKATDRVIGGLESNKIMSPSERQIVAHHEAGHAVAGWFLEHADPLLKVTIIPRASGALGFAQYLPKEVFLRSQDQIMDIVCMALAGRAAEEIFFGSVTTGASDDLNKVTRIVYSTIRNYGMNSTVGQLVFDDDEEKIGDKPYSDSTAEAMDDEARKIVDTAYERTLALIREHKDDVEKIAKLLIEKETIVHDDLVNTIGPRPFQQDSVYQEYVSNKDALHKKVEEEKSHKKKEESIDGGDMMPGLA
jgi:AFG3 family protein